MKKNILFLIIAALMIGGCSQDRKSPLKGAWQLVYATNANVPIFPSGYQGGQIKIFSDENFSFAGRFERDTLSFDNFGGGAYILNGNRFEEKVLYHSTKELVGKTTRILMQVRNDTLIQTWPVDEAWNLINKHHTEKYIRLK